MYCLRREPDLEEILGDPIVIAVMRRDAVAEANLRHVIEVARSRFSLGSEDPREDPCA